MEKYAFLCAFVGHANWYIISRRELLSPWMGPCQLRNFASGNSSQGNIRILYSNIWLNMLILVLFIKFLFKKAHIQNKCLLNMKN